MFYQWKLYKDLPPGPLACHELICELLQQPFGLAKTISHANQYPWYGTLPAKGAQKFQWLLRNLSPSLACLTHQVFASDSDFLSHVQKVFSGTHLYLQAPVQPLRTCDTLSEGPVIWIVALSFASLTCQRLRYSNRHPDWKYKDLLFQNLVILLT